MARFLVVWACLTAALAVTTAVLSFAVFRHLDLRYVALVHLLAIPVVQALAVGWVRGEWSLSQQARAVRAALRHRWFAALLLLDLGVLAGDHLGSGFAIGAAEDRVALTTWWPALQAAAAGALLLVALPRAHGGWRRRPWLLALAVGALAIAGEPWCRWLEAAPDLLPGLLPTAGRWLVTYGGMAAIGLIVLVRSAATVRDADPVAAFLLDLAAALLFALMLVLVLSLALHPFLNDPWATLVAILTLGCSTCVLAGSLGAVRARGLRADRQ